MAHDQYDLFFNGSILPGHDPDQVQAAVARLFKADAAQLRHLFSGKNLCIRHAVDVETAGRYRAALRQAGALIEVRPSTPRGVAAPVSSAPAGTDAAPSTAGLEVCDDGPEFELLPPRSGSLADCAPPPPPPPAVDLTGMALTPPGVILETHPQPPPLQIDISHLSAAPPHSGSLADCVINKPTRPIPDISHLRLVED